MLGVRCVARIVAELPLGIEPGSSETYATVGAKSRARGSAGLTVEGGATALETTSPGPEGAGGGAGAGAGDTGAPTGLSHAAPSTTSGTTTASRGARIRRSFTARRPARSEEHTSELQSR